MRTSERCMRPEKLKDKEGKVREKNHPERRLSKKRIREEKDKERKVGKKIIIKRRG